MPTISRMMSLNEFYDLAGMVCVGVFSSYEEESARTHPHLTIYPAYMPAHCMSDEFDEVVDLGAEILFFFFTFTFVQKEKSLCTPECSLP